MSKEMVISANRHETKVAILEEDQLVEIFFQRANEYSLAGSIHKGRVTRVLPGMQSAFVDLGLERDTFLYVSDFFEENEEYDRILPVKEDRPARNPNETNGWSGWNAWLRNPSRSVCRWNTDPSPIEPAEVPDLIEAAHIAPKPTAGWRHRLPSGAKTPRSGSGEDGGREGGGIVAEDFPESKYASDAGEAPKSELQEPEVRRIPAPADDFEFPVLPGESLAKYRRSASDTDADPEPEEEEAANSIETPFDPEPEQEPDARSGSR